MAFGLGYPGECRWSDQDVLDLRPVIFCDFVTSVSDRHFVIVDENFLRQSIEYDPQVKKLSSLGGMSGASVYIQNQDTKQYILCGFVYEASDEGQNSKICVSHASYINPDGKIDRCQLPYL